MPHLRLSLVLLLLAGCGDSAGPNGGGGNATLSGTVRSTLSSAGLSGATVSIGSRQATSDANGRFELTDVPLGTATVRAERPGYMPVQASVTVTEGANSQDFTLAPKEIYELGTNATFVPAGPGPIRGAIVVIGGPVASGFVTGERLTPPTSSPELEISLQALGASLRDLARSTNVALLGTSITGMDNSAASDDELFSAMSTVAQMSGRPELADARVLMFGLSAGGPEAAGLVSRHPDRAIGLLVRVPTDVTSLTAAQALAVPTFVMQAELDGVVNNPGVHTKFSANRSRGGRWALAIEPGIGHSVATDRGNSTAISWIRLALELRLPATHGDALVGLDESSGWLGDQSTLEIASWADYPGTRAEASWLLSQSAAASWSALGSPKDGE